jgi:hypothetical protein
MGDLADAGPDADLAFIRKVMEDSRRTVEFNGIYFVIWGCACLAGTALSYLEGRGGAAHLIGPTWACLGAAGAAASAIAGRRERKRARSFAGTLLSSIWLVAILLGLALGGGMALAGRLDLPLGMALTSGVVAAGYLLSSAVSRLRSLALLSIPWWAGSVLIGLLPEMAAPLALASLTFAFELVPGFVMVAWGRKPRDGQES